MNVECVYHITQEPPLTQISMAGPFDRFGVGFLTVLRGLLYLFTDCTIWPKVFATKDQSSLTSAKLLIEHIVS